MSFVLVVSRGIFARTSPGWTSSPILHHQVRAGGHQVFSCGCGPAEVHETRMVGGMLFIAPAAGRDDQLREAR